MKFKTVVTSFLRANQEILLLKRSAKVGTHRGRWAGVSGYLEENEDPLQRAMTEITEELGLSHTETTLVRQGEPLRAYDEESDTVWIVHPFLFEAKSKSVRLDWENAEYKWINPRELDSYATVPKLRETFDRVQCDTQSNPMAHSKVLRDVEKLGQDRIHGASVLGQQALNLLAEAAQASDAQTSEALFCDLVIVASRLRMAQPCMATIRNLAGMLLQQTRLKRNSSSAAELRNQVASIAKQLAEGLREASEDASRLAATVLPRGGCVLTHSYSTAVLRALELGNKGRREFQVYATESYPGMEGKQLAKGLIQIGVPVKLVPDSTMGLIMPDVDLVVLGADSVLADGSLVHKVGTKKVAAAAKEKGISLYSVCETTKFSTADFLGEPLKTSGTLFDITPSEYVTEYVTETGFLEPSEIEARIKSMLSEIYP